jgi:hypothetical protein
MDWAAAFGRVLFLISWQIAREIWDSIEKVTSMVTTSSDVTAVYLFVELL